jgi:signal recognition particle subunit SRP54
MFEQLASNFSSLFSRLTGQSKLTEQNIAQVFRSLQDALLDADVPQDVVDAFLSSVRTDVVGQKLTTASLKPGEQFAKIVYDRLVDFLGAKQSQEFFLSYPARIVVLGLQGSGKTTSLAKLAYYAKEQMPKEGKKKTILMASVDVYRPAAIEQLEILARQLEVSFYRSTSSNPIQATRDIMAYQANNKFDLLLFDTAGRLHVDQEMIKEVQELMPIVNPTHKLLVLDSMIGQESLTVAKNFDQAIGFDGALLTKMDSDTRGGAAFAFRYSLGKPIVFVGVGERAEDLEPFRAERVARRIIGMGDLQGLIERAETKIKDHEKEGLEKAFTKNKLTLEDFAQHLALVERMGPLENLLKQLPMVAGANVAPEMVRQGQAEMKQFKAIISSMTVKERRYPALLDNMPRRQRIARGAGVAVADIKKLLERFEKSQQFVKLFKRWGQFPGFS